MPLVSSGVEHGNLRELALARMKDMGTEVRTSDNSPNINTYTIKINDTITVMSCLLMN